MRDTNNITLIGRLTRDVGSDERDFGYLQNGTCYAKVSIAVNESKKGQDGNWADYANFFEVHVYGKSAENLKSYLIKGQQVCVTGSLHQDRWQDKQTGNNQSKVVIKSDNIQLIGGKREDNGQQPQQNTAYNGYTPPNTTAGQPYPQNNAPQNQPPQNNGGYQSDNYGSNFPEDIPF